MHNKKVCKINGIEYNSLDEIPKELKPFITQDLLEKLKNNRSENSRTSLIVPVSEKSIEFRAMKWFFYFVSHMLSLAENQAMRTIAIILNLVDVNVYLSLFFSLLIGQFSHSLAQKYYIKKTPNLNIQYSDSLNFLKRFEISQIGAIYSLFFNFLFFLVLFLVKPIY